VEGLSPPHILLQEGPILKVVERDPNRCKKCENPPVKADNPNPNPNPRPCPNQGNYGFCAECRKKKMKARP
jgi:hypothetical protein